MCAAAVILSTGTKIINEDTIMNGTRSEGLGDSAPLFTVSVQQYHVLFSAFLIVAKKDADERSSALAITV